MNNNHQNNKYRIALIVRTDGLDYDDRVRKEVLSVCKLYDFIEFYIYVISPRNILEAGVSSYGTPYKALHLKSVVEGNNKFNLFNAIELYCQLKKELKNYDAIWIADQQPFLIGLLVRNKPIIWDLHELPLTFMKNRVLSMLFRHIEKKCNAVIHANEARMQYMSENDLVTIPTKHYVLHNFPQIGEIDSVYDDTYKDFIKWLGDDQCVYLQGVDMERRAPFESISSIIGSSNLKIVVIGEFDENVKKALFSKYGSVAISRIFYTGRIKQIKTSQYIQRCVLSLVFYKNTNPNNNYCEPNRLFQCIINDKPVVVGCNPPMKELINQYAFGVCVNTDGSDEEEIASGINKVLNNYQYFLDNIRKNKRYILWENQEDTIKQIITAII